MRRLITLGFVLGATASTTAASPSNPAFLGISFGPAMIVQAVNQKPMMLPGARIDTVTPDSPAARAGLQSDDRIFAIDGQAVDVNTVNKLIIAHEPGDKIRIEIDRMGQDLVVTPTLTTRAAMFDLLLGRPFTADIEDHDGVELGKSSGHATVVAWYHAGGGGACIDPVPVLDDIGRRVAALKHSNAVVVGATYDKDEEGSHDAIESDRERLGRPILRASHEAFQRYAIEECSRVFVTVIDGQGIVTFLTPITNGDDEDAALDEIASAAAQADHKRR